MKIKFRGIDNYGIVTQESSGLKAHEILARYSTVSQSTGLFDRDGVEIYEGDILDVSEPNCETLSAAKKEVELLCTLRYGIVRRDSKTGMLACFFPAGKVITHTRIGESAGFKSDYKKKVVGNIFEAPDFDFGEHNFDMKRLIRSFNQ